MVSILCIVGVLLASSVIYCLRHRSHHKLKEKLTNLGSDTGSDATATYQVGGLNAASIFVLLLSGSVCPEPSFQRVPLQVTLDFMEECSGPFFSQHLFKEGACNTRVMNSISTEHDPYKNHYLCLGQSD